MVWTSPPAATMVAEFNTAFDRDIPNEQMTADDFGVGDEPMLFGLIAEEFKELQEARAAGDLDGVIDALQDLKYVIYGYELRMGISSEDHFAEVHAANMRKLGPDGKPIYRDDGKILKPEGWTGPDHAKVRATVEQTGGIFMEAGTSTVH